MPNKEEKEQNAQIYSESLKKDLGVEQVVHMKVAAQIVQHLSKGIYSNPAYCIKELIDNSFDADARSVIVRAKPEFDVGMPPKNWSSYNVRKTKPVKRGIDGQKRVHSRANHQ